MKNSILLNLLGFNPDLTTRQSRVDSVSIASRYRVLAILLLFFTIGSGNVWGDTFTKATSIAAGDVVIFVSEYATVELTSVSSTSTVYGIGTSYSTTPAGTWQFTVEEGNSDGTFSFKNSSNNYLYWNSGNSLNVNSSKTANTSWTVNFDGSGNATIANASSSARIIWWNQTSTRFACYTDKSEGNNNNTYFRYVQIYKKASSCANKVTLTKGSTTNGTFDLDKANGEHDNCDANFVVHVSNIVPADGSKYCNGIDATGGNSTVTGPVEGVWTVTYTKGNSITSTITPTYATKTSYTVTWYNEGASIGTESVYSGDKVSALPSPAPTSSCSGEFIGWVRSDADVADKSVTDAYTTQPTAPTLFTDVAGSPTITGNTAFHAVYRMPKPD